MAYGELGPTHHSIEDLAWTRAIASLTVIVPADPIETAQAVRAAAAIDGPVFLRVEPHASAERARGTTTFAIGRAATLRGRRRHLVAAGVMVSRRARGSTDCWRRTGISAAVLNMSTVRPIDRESDRSTRRDGVRSSRSRSTRSSAGSGAPWRKWSWRRAQCACVCSASPAYSRPTGSAEFLLRALRADTRKAFATRRGRWCEAEPMSDRHVLAIDQGTTNTKALLFDEHGSVVARAIRHDVSFPQPGWVEQDAVAIWRSVDTADRRVPGPRGRRRRLDAVRDHEPAGIGVVWERATGTARRSRASSGSAGARRRSARRCATAASRAWLAGNDRADDRSAVLGEQDALAARSRFRMAHARAEARRAAPRDGRQLAAVESDRRGGARVRRSNASRTQLFDLRSGAWDADLLNMFGIPPAVLPDGRAVERRARPHHRRAGVSPAAFRSPALIGDSHAALFGHARLRSRAA